MVGLETLYAIYVIWQKPCDRHSNHECHFNLFGPSGSREVLYLFLLTSVNLTSFHFLYPFSLEKDSGFLFDIEPFVCNFFPEGIGNGSMLLFTQVGFCIHMPFVTTLWECDMTTIKF